MSSSSRKCLRSQTRETIAKVHDFMESDAKQIMALVRDPLYHTDQVLISKLCDHLNVLIRRTAKATGVSPRTVSRVLAERKQFGPRCRSPYQDRKKSVKDSKVDSALESDHLNVYDADIEIKEECVYPSKVDIKTENYESE